MKKYIAKEVLKINKIKKKELSPKATKISLKVPKIRIKKAQVKVLLARIKVSIRKLITRAFIKVVITKMVNIIWVQIKVQEETMGEGNFQKDTYRQDKENVTKGT